MKDLAFKHTVFDTMYPTENKKKEKRYPSVTLPLSLLTEEKDIGDEITITVKGKLERVEKSKYYEEFTVKLASGEVKGTEKKKGTTLATE